MFNIATMADSVDDASKAYAAVSAKLDSWTSPKVGKMSANWRTYEEDAVQWMETTMGQEPCIALTPKKRSADHQHHQKVSRYTSNEQFCKETR